MLKLQDLRKLNAELERIGGLEEGVRQLQLNTTLENRRNELEIGNEALRNTRTILEENLAKRLRDDTLEQEKHEQRMARNRQEHEEFVRCTNAERRRMTDENDEIRKMNAAIKTENLTLREENKLSRWILAIARKDKGAVQHAADYLLYPSKHHLTEPPPQLTDSMLSRLMTILQNELTAEGLLVPLESIIELKTKLAVAKREIYNYRLTVQLTLGLLRMFLETPMMMRTDQRRAMLWIIKQIGPRSQEELLQLVKTLQNSERCPVHGITMLFDDQRSLWVCPVQACTCRR